MEKRTYNRENAAKRRETVRKHLQKVYAGKVFTVADVKKSLNGAIRSWAGVSSVEAELSVCFRACQCQITGKAENTGKRGKPANLWTLPEV